MSPNELREIIACGETSKVQFKERLDNKDSITAEMIAFANCKGGKIIFGVEDKLGIIKGLDYAQLQVLNTQLSTLANDFVKPQIFISTDVVSIDENGETKRVMICEIEEGTAKPYKDKNGTIWVKQGGDKRKLTDNNEQIRLFQQNGLLYVDEMVVPNTSISDIAKYKVDEYLEKIDDNDNDLESETLYKNLNIVNGERLTLGGLIFFAKNPQRYRPAFGIKAVCFYGNDIEGTEYRDSQDITGTLPLMYEGALAFFKRNLHHVQNGQNFNSTGILEISQIALEELIQNALTHRDYSKNASINLFIFDDRIEIISPGSLPNNLTIENIKMGNAVVRNNLIVSFSSKIMRYRGICSGIRRALKEEPGLILIDDKDNDRFIAIIKRK